MMLSVSFSMPLVWMLAMLSIIHALEADLIQQTTLSARSSKKLLKPGPAITAAQIRDALELAQEREQVLAAQTSIADWRKSLHKHGKTATRGEALVEEKLSRDQQEQQQPHHHRQRKKRAEHNDVYSKKPPFAGKNSGKNKTTTALDRPTADPEDLDDTEASVVCYGPLGCFHETDHLPEMLPSSPAEVNTRFMVYTTTHRSEKPLIEFSYEELVVAGFGAAYWSNGTNDTVSIPVTSGMSSSLLQTFGDLSDRTVRVIVHGFGANCGLVWIYEMRTALMAVENCTVICVDWENGAKLPNYVRAAANTRLVGRQLALLLRLLRTHNGLRLSRVHLIGFSLGSHVAGFAGAEFTTTSSSGTSATPAKSNDDNDDDEDVDNVDTDETHHYGVDLERKRQVSDEGAQEPEHTGLWRITGLDPAGPLFEAQPPEVRLDASDAQYVDVIHSNGENLILGGLGSWQPMGTVDYYPNGGRVQHGCTNLFVGAVTDIIWAPPTTVEGRSLCNHRRAYKFFIDSVAPRCHFPAFPCESYDRFATGDCFECGPGRRNGSSSACGHMGYYATSRDVGGYGQLYLRTRDEEPYCANQFRLRLRNAPDELPLRTVGRFELTLEGGDTGNGVGEQPGTVTLITFNETFHLDETREDREFHAGQWLTTILVPHPALGHRPRALTITYRPYRGGWWQRSSVGKQLWRIGPILLTADDQRTYGSCETLTLQADVPVRLELTQIQLIPRDTLTNTADGDADDDDENVGECRVIETLESRQPKQSVAPPPDAGSDGKPASAPGRGGAKSSIDELVQSGQHDHFSWTPVAISIPRQPHGPHMQQPHHSQRPHVNEKRSFAEPDGLQFSQQGAAAKGGHISTDDAKSQARDAAVSLPLESSPATGTAQTVQLFPSRLVSFFERAERYARRTWDALFSGNITGTEAGNETRESSTAVTGGNGATNNAGVPPPLLTTTVVDLLSQAGVPSPVSARSTAMRKSDPSSMGTGAGGAGSTTAQENGSGTSASNSADIHIALPTFRPAMRTTHAGSVGSGRQHYTRFIPLIYEEAKDQPVVQPQALAGVRKDAKFMAKGESS